MMEFYCGECEQRIEEKHFLIALDRTWHEECLKCACCLCRLFDFGDRFYTRSGLLLCARDYVRLFGQYGHCELCSGQISPHEWVMGIGHCANANNDNNKNGEDGGIELGNNARENGGQQKGAVSSKRLLAHLECFACSTCKGRFCIGEHFYFQKGLIFCQKDFIGKLINEERKEEEQKQW